MKLPFFKPDIFTLSPVEEIQALTRGENRRGVLVAAQLAEGEEAEQLDLLTKILNSVQLNGMEDALLLKLSPSLRFSLSALCKATGCQKVLLLGASPGRLGLHFRIEKYKPFRINGIHGLWADDLSGISASRDLKTALWTSLKQLFPTT